MAVSRDKQGKGVGSQLIKALEEECKSHEVKKIILKTLSDREDYEPYVKTRAFYKKHGFKKARYIKEKGKEELVVMQKRI